MNPFNLILAEILARPVSFLLSIMAVVVAASLFVAGPTLLAGYASHTNQELDKLQSEADVLEGDAKQMQEDTEKELAELDKQTIRIMRDLGVNLRIVHKETNMGNLYTDFQAHEFPEQYVHQLAEAPSIETIVHVVASLVEKIKWKDRTVLMVGTLPVLTLSQKNEEKPHMVKNVEPGTALVGHELGTGLQPGDKIEIDGYELTVAKIMPEFGSLEDVQLVVHLSDAQKMLDKEGMINQIMALNCKCKGDRISVIRAELEGVLPDTKVTEHRTNAEAREKQRDLVAAKRKQQLDRAQVNLRKVQENREQQQTSFERQETLLANLVTITTPLVVLVSALFVGLMTWLNVRERRSEIGLLRALGKGTGFVVSLFFGRAIVSGLVGGLIGCALGYAIALWVGSAMEVPEQLFRPDSVLLAATALGAPFIAAIASYLPTLAAVRQDPAVVLMDA